MFLPWGHRRDTRVELQSFRVKVPLLTLSLVVMSSAACSGVADIPNTPDLSQLLQDYEHPTASLDETSVAQAISDMPSLKQLAAGVDAPEYVTSGVDDASMDSSGSTGSRLRVQGSVAVHVRCPGELGNPVYDEAINGSISFTLALAENRIRRSF